MMHKPLRPIWTALLAAFLLAFCAAGLHAQESETAGVENLAISFRAPAQAVRGHRPIEFTITVRNQHPRLSATFDAVITLLPGLEGPLTWSQPEMASLDSAGRNYAWSARVAPGKSVSITFQGYTGSGTETGIEVWLESNRDRIQQAWTVVLVRGQGRATGRLQLSDIRDERCDLGDTCKLTLFIASPTAAQYSVGPISTRGCAFLDLPARLTSSPNVTYTRFFLRVVRSQGEFGCGITVPVRIGDSTLTIRYLEPVLRLPRLVRER